MKSLVAIFCLSLSLISFAAETGKPAPDFTVKGISLNDFKGKIVVLEWLNHGCPFVRKHYDTNNMQNLQKKYVDKGVIWFSIISSGPGKQGHVSRDEAIKQKESNHSSATDILLDESGTIGKLYNAKTTPHMFVIDREGTLVYQGAIDDQANYDKKSVPGAKNFVALAIDDLLAKRKVKIPGFPAYGCSVKYAE